MSWEDPTYDPKPGKPLTPLENFYMVLIAGGALVTYFLHLPPTSWLVDWQNAAWGCHYPKLTMLVVILVAYLPLIAFSKWRKRRQAEEENFQKQFAMPSARGTQEPPPDKQDKPGTGISPTGFDDWLDSQDNRPT